VAKPGKSAERRKRLAAALRENLKRRKARARAQAVGGPEPPAEGAGHAPDLPSADPNKAANRG
jgi:hypothetical protein